MNNVQESIQRKVTGSQRSWDNAGFVTQSQKGLMLRVSDGDIADKELTIFVGKQGENGFSVILNNKRYWVSTKKHTVSEAGNKTYQLSIPPTNQ